MRPNKQLLLAATVQASALFVMLLFGRRNFTPFGRGGRLAYSAEALRGSRIAGRSADSG